jgi:hypothetical protein
MLNNLLDFGPGITEPTDPRSDGKPYDITQPIFMLPVASVSSIPHHADLHRLIADGIFEALYGR